MQWYSGGWFGMSEWKECKLGEIYDFASGLSKSRDQFGFGYSFLSFRDVFHNYFVPKEITQLANSTEKERERCSIKRGDVFLTRTSETQEELGMSSVALKDYPDATFNGFTKRLRPKNNTEIVPEYAGFYFRSPRFRATMTSMASITTRASLNNGMLSELTIVIPPLPEQRAIASVLSSLDGKIDLLHRQNKTLEAMAETLFRQWFVEEADEGWREGKIPDEFDFTMGLSPPGESYNEEGIGIPLYQGNADFEFRFPKRRVFTTDPKRFAEQFDTLISVRAPVGAQNMAGERCCIGRGVATFRYKRNNNYYTYTHFKMKSLMKEIEQFNQTGTVFGSISKSDFEDLAIAIPSVEFVDAFQKDIKPTDDKVIANCMQIRTLEKLRDVLLPKLMSGEVRVEMEVVNV